jgi:alcohol dehydrogenase
MQCRLGGWMLGSKIDGTCADYVRVPFADHSLISTGGAGERDTDGPWIENIPEGFRRGSFHGPDEPTDTSSIVFGGSVGIDPLLTVMQYYRTVVRPALDVDRNRQAHPQHHLMTASKG